jgi:hypothetical protein
MEGSAMSEVQDLLTLVTGGTSDQAAQALGGEAAAAVIGSLTALRGLTACRCGGAEAFHATHCLADYRPDVESLDAALAVLVFALAGAGASS